MVIGCFAVGGNGIPFSSSYHKLFPGETVWMDGDGVVSWSYPCVYQQLCFKGNKESR